MHLRRRGHDVRAVVGAPAGVVRRHRIDGLPVTYVRVAVPRFATRRGWTPETAFAPVALGAALAASHDIVHALHYADAWGALQARRLRRRPVVLKLTGTVEPDRMREVRVDRRMFREAIDRADAVWCNSEYAREAMRGWGRPMQVVPAGVDLERFAPVAQRAARPTVLCTSAPTEPRKRLTDVMQAWPLVLDVHADAELLVAGAATAETRDRLLAMLPVTVRHTVRFLGDVGDDALPALYSAAHACLAPAVHEALGLATLEALACGTPVAGARSGATADLVADGTGALFTPRDAASCADAVVRAVSLSADPDVQGRCRAVAERFRWERVAAEIERRYLELTH